MKYPDIRAVSSEDDELATSDFQTFNLPTFSKLYERLIYGQLYPYFDDVFSKFSKHSSAQYCLTSIILK